MSLKKSWLLGGASCSTVLGCRWWLVASLSWWCCAALPEHSFAQRDVIDVNVGDIIEFEFHGKVQQKKVIELVGSGKWFRVMADFAGREVPHVVLPHKAKIVSRGMAAQPSLPAEPRTWMDHTGKFSVEAKLFEVKENEVSLLKGDGNVVTLSIDKLSESDQAYLKQLAEQQAAEIDPFAGGVPASPAPPADSAGTTSRADRIPVPPRGSLPVPGKDVIATLEVALDPVEWTYVPGDYWQHVSDSSLQLPPALFPKDKEFFTKSVMYFSGNSGELLSVLRTNAFADFSQASVFDIGSKELLGDFRLPYKDLKDVVMSPDRQTLVTIHPQFGVEQGGIVFWDIDDDQLVARDAWNFSSLRATDKFSAHSSMFVDNNHLFTIGSHLALWDIETAKTIYSISAPGAWATSRDHQHLLFFQKGSFWLLRIKDGQLVGRISGDPKLLTTLRSIDFSPDGRQIVAAAGGVVYGFDLSNGQPTFKFDTGQNVSSVQWADNSLLLVNQRTVIDPKLEAPVWEFTLDNGLQLGRVGSTAWITSVNQMVGAELINANRRNEIAKNTVGLKAEDLPAFGPGTRLALVTKLEHLGEPAGPAISAMKKHLEARGFVLDDRAPLKLEAVVTRGKTVDEVVRDHFGSLFGPVNERIRYTPHSSHLTLSLNGDVLWRTSANYSAAGPMLMLNGNETPQQAVERLCRPNPRFFTTAPIPTKLSRLPKDRRIGKSKITAAGLQ